MVYTRNGPYGTSAPCRSAACRGVQPVRARSLQARSRPPIPSKLIFGYSSAISPIADWRVGCVDFEALVADGYHRRLDRADLGRGMAGLVASALERLDVPDRQPAHARRDDRQGERSCAPTPCRFYNLIETWDGWEPWDTLHQVPDKLRWAIWAFSHAAVAHAERRQAARRQLRLVGQQRRAGTAQRRGRRLRQHGISTRRRRARRGWNRSTAGRWSTAAR